MPLLPPRVRCVVQGITTANEAARCRSALRQIVGNASPIWVDWSDVVRPSIYASSVHLQSRYEDGRCWFDWSELWLYEVQLASTPETGVVPDLNAAPVASRLTGLSTPFDSIFTFSSWRYISTDRPIPTTQCRLTNQAMTHTHRPEELLLVDPRRAEAATTRQLTSKLKSMRPLAS